MIPALVCVYGSAVRQARMKAAMSLPSIPPSAALTG